MRIASILLAACPLVVVACASTPPSAPAPAVPTAATTPPDGTIDGAKAHELVKNGARLIDVRSPAEYAEKHIEGAVNVPVDQIDGQDMGPKDTPIVVYCQRGGRAKRALESLRAKGYTDVHSLGGMSNWDK